MRRSAFTLIEMLIVIALIAMLSALLVPAMKGLTGVAGVRGGVNTLTGALEQARLTAMQNGTTAYVGFPFQATNKESSHSSVIILRRDTTNTNNVVAVTRWIKLPQGIMIEPGANFATNTTLSGTANLPRLDTQSVNVSSLAVLSFDRFGKLRPDTQPVTLRLGEKVDRESEFLGSTNNCFELTVQPLTGRVVIRDKRGT